MTNEKNENSGTAFPYQYPSHKGLTKREYYAAMAMAVDLNSSKILLSKITDDELLEGSRMCFRVADAMIKAGGE